MKILLEFLRLKVIEIGTGLWKCIKCIGGVIIGFSIIVFGLFGIGCLVSCFISVESEDWWFDEIYTGALTIGVLIVIIIIMCLSHEFLKWLKGNWRQAKENVQRKGK